MDWGIVKVLVTGGSGFIGRHLVAGLSRRHDVVSPSHSVLDLTDAAAVGVWLDEHPVDAVVHAAVRPAHRNAPDPTSVTDQNLRQFYGLMSRRSSFGRLVVLGSGAAYGMQRSVTGASESEIGAVIPTDELGFSKYVEARELGRDARAVELRPFGVFGPGEDYAIRFISNACCKAALGLPVTLRRDRRFSYVWVEDLVTIVECALFDSAAGGLEAGAYNVTPIPPTQLSDVARLIVELAGNAVPLKVAEEGMDLDYYGDGAKLRAAMPEWQPLALGDGVRRLYDWYAERRGQIDRSVLMFDR